MNRLRLGLLALLLAALPALFAACGNGAASDSVDSILRDTFESGKSIDSGRIALDMNADLKGLEGVDGPIGLKLSGPFQSGGDNKLPRMDLSLAINTQGQGFTAGAIVTATQAFIKFGGETYSVPAEIFSDFKNGYEKAASAGSKDKKKDAGTTFASLGVHPREWLDGARKLPNATVGGAEATHITAKVDVGKFVDDMNKIIEKAGSLGVTSGTKIEGITSLQKLGIEQSIKTSRVDVYSGVEDRVLRRLTVTLGIDVPELARASVGGLQTGTVKFDLLLADVNKDQTIEAPKGPTRSLGELLARFGVGSGDSSSGSGTVPEDTTTTTTPATPATPAASRKYLDCLEKAGNDLAKVQKCATLLK